MLMVQRMKSEGQKGQSIDYIEVVSTAVALLGREHSLWKDF